MTLHRPPRPPRAPAPLVALAGALLLGAAPPPAPAPAPTPAPAGVVEHPAWAKPYAGAWTLSGVSEGDPVCGLTFGSDAVIGGASVTVSATCRRNYPFEDVVGWRLQRRSIVLIDALRRPVHTFTPGPEHSWSGEMPGGRGVTLERGAPDKPKSLRALIDGESFTLSGPDNKDPCGFAMTAPSSASGGMEQAGRCAPAWRGRGWRSWTIVNGRMLLRDGKDGVVLSLAREDDFTFTADTSQGPVFFGPGEIDGSEMRDAAGGKP